MRRAVPVLLAALTLLVAACRGESVTRLRISPEGTATVISEFAFDEEALAIIGDLDDTPEEVLRALSEYIDPEALPVAAAGVEPEQFQREDLHGIRVTIPGLDPNEVATELASGDSIIDDVVLTLDDGMLLMEGRTRNVPDFERARLLALVPGDLSQVLSLVLQVEVPGSVSAHNADRVLAEGVLEWDLLPAIIEGEDVFVTVEAEVEPGFQFVDLEGRPFTPADAATTEDGTAWWVAVLPFLLAAAISWLIIGRLRKRNRLSEIEGFTPKG